MAYTWPIDTYNKPPASNLYDYSQGMENTPDTAVPLIDVPANPPVNKMSMIPEGLTDYISNLWGSDDTQDYPQYAQAPKNPDFWQLAKELPGVYKDAWDERWAPKIRQTGSDFYEDVQQAGGVTPALAEKLTNLPYVGDAFKGWETIGAGMADEDVMATNPIYQWRKNTLNPYMDKFNKWRKSKQQFYQDAAPDRFSNTVAPGVGGKNISSLDFAPPYTGGRKHAPNDPMGGGLFNLLMSSISPRWSGEGKYSEKFPARTFTEGDRTLTQKGLGGHYSPYEKDIMESFGQVGEYGDPRKDIFNQNIVSFAGDHEEKLREWVKKYGTRQSKDKKFLERQAAKNAMLQQINERKAAEARPAPTGQWQPDPGRSYSDRELSQIGRQHYTGPGMAFEARPSGRNERGYTGGRAQGGYMRSRYKTGGRVGILAAF